MKFFFSLLNSHLRKFAKVQIRFLAVRAGVANYILKITRITTGTLFSLCFHNVKLKCRMYFAGSTNLIEDGFYDAGQIRPNTKFMSIEDYCKQELNDKRPILFIIAKAEYVTSKPILIKWVSNLNVSLLEKLISFISRGSYFHSFLL